jgi:hypothetical protein
MLDRGEEARCHSEANRQRSVGRLVDDFATLAASASVRVPRRHQAFRKIFATTLSV